jgi:FtsP/CotA-like multicopper oxidase with cupredoxin domain
MRAGLLALATAILIAAYFLLRPAEEPPPAPTAATVTATPSPASTTEPDTAGTPTPTATPSPRPTPDRRPLLTTAGVRDIRVRKGETVRFRVRSSKPEEVHVHGHDLTREVQPGRTARMAFKATIDGIFEIEFEKSGTPIAQLRVDS